MDALDLARWQFGITTVYHFLFVPLTISLTFIVAMFQTAWYRTGNEKYLKATRFYGELMLINFAMGVVTGIVQEFQFGMNWSDYSRFVGDIFGAPLAIEGLLAFFLESTFLGIWIFGWDKLSKEVHLASIWIVAVGTHPLGLLHPGRQRVDAAAGRLRVINAGGRPSRAEGLPGRAHEPHRPLRVPARDRGRVHDRRRVRPGSRRVAARHAGPTRPRAVPDRPPRSARSRSSSVGSSSFASGDQLGKHITVDQPMKLAAAESLYDHPDRRPVLGDHALGPDGKEIFSLEVPNVLSFLATNNLDGHRPGNQRPPGSVRGRSTAPATTRRSFRSPSGRSGS